MSNVTAKRL